MARVDVAPVPTGRTETPEEKAFWLAVRKYIKSNRLNVSGSIFTMRAIIGTLEADQGGRPFKKMVKDDKGGGEKPWYYFKAHPVVIDPEFGGDGVSKGQKLQPKDIGYSWFNGQMGDGRQSPNKGGMYVLHSAVYHAPPTDGRENGGGWDTTDYEGKPILLEWEFLGVVQEGEKYYGLRSNLNVRLNKFRPDPAAAAPTTMDDDDETDVVYERVAAAPSLDNLDDDNF